MHPFRSRSRTPSHVRNCGRNLRCTLIFTGANRLTACVVYCRVSTDKQAERGQSIRAQIEACAAHAARLGWTVSATFTDEGVSAGKPLDKRPGLVAAIGRLGKNEVLLVAKRDRLFRSDPLECALIERAVAGRGARVASAAGEGTDDDAPSSVLIRTILDAVALYERLLAKVRTTAVIRSKQARGERVGQIPYGTRVGADGRTLEPDPDERSTIGWMRRLWNEGCSLRSIAAELNLMSVPTKRGGPWSHSSVFEVLRRDQAGRAKNLPNQPDPGPGARG